MGNVCCGQLLHENFVRQFSKSHRLYRNYSSQNLVENQEEEINQTEYRSVFTSQKPSYKPISKSAVDYEKDYLGPTVREEFVKFPFLENQELAKYIINTRFMFIMRGPAGSGKSYIVKCMKNRYPSLKHCSADKFWYTQSKDGETYAFDIERLSEAHDYCKNEVYNACEEKASPIVVDNTNIRCWEFKYYIELARKYDYQIILVSPQTPWRFDPVSLADRNLHCVSLETEQTMVRKFETANPLYYGWFVPPKLSKFGYRHKQFSSFNPSYTSGGSLANWASLIISKVVSQQIVGDYFRKSFDLQPSCDVAAVLRSWTNTNNIKVDGLRSIEKKQGPFHITSFFMGNGKSDLCKLYSNLSSVADSLLGLVKDIQIYGVFISKRTIGIRVGIPLDTENLRLLWGGFDKETVIGADNEDNVANRSVGCRAHFTLGVYPGITPVETGYDVLRLVDHESNSIFLYEFEEGKLYKVNIPGMWEQNKLIEKTYDEDYEIFYYKLHKPFTVKCIYGGYY